MAWRQKMQVKQLPQLATSTKKGGPMRYLIFILVLVSFLYAADSTAVFHIDSMNSGHSTMYKGLGVDVVQLQLFDNSENTSDTMAAGDYLIIGPISLSAPGRSGEGQFSYMNVVGQALAAGDTAQLDYQITCGNLITDTASNWTSFDSCDAVSGVSQTVVDLTQKTGNRLWIRAYNITAGAIVMANKLKLYLRSKRPIK